MKRKEINTQKTLTNNKVFAVISYININYIHYSLELIKLIFNENKTTERIHAHSEIVYA
jgi:hypothetical protein